MTISTHRAARTLLILIAVSGLGICPTPSIAQAPATPAASQWPPASIDILGIKLGQSGAEVKKAIGAYKAGAVITDHTGKTFEGFPDALQMIRARYGVYEEFKEPYPVGNEYQEWRLAEQINGKKVKWKQRAETIEVSFAGVPGQEKVIAVGRTQNFEKAGAPTPDAILSSLEAKFGKPTETEKYDNSRFVMWAYDSRNRPEKGYSCRPADTLLPDNFRNNCAWGIGLSVRTFSDNPSLVSSYTISFTHQKDAYDALQKQDAGLKEMLAKKQADEAAKAGKPPLKF